MRNSFYLLLLLVASCKTPRYIYSPSPPNNPYFTEKGQAKVNAYYSTGGNDNATSGQKNNGFDLQAAYAVSNNWALTASYFNRSERDIYPSKSHNFFDSSVVGYRRNMVEIGGGYFKMLTRKNAAYFESGSAITFNLYGGVGFGKFTINDHGRDTASLAYLRYHRAAITKWFLQPSFNFITGKYFRFSLVDKISIVHYGKISTSYSTEELSFLQLDKLPGRTISFIEPSLNIQIGMPGADWLKIDGGFTFTAEPMLSDAPNLKSRFFNASIGICATLPVK